MRKPVIILLCMAMLLSTSYLAADTSNDVIGQPIISEKTAYNVSTPFRINSNAEFAAMAAAKGWPGDGSQGNQYIIDNYDINGSGYGCCIYIGNTTCYFTIQNCYLHHAGGYPIVYFGDAGIYLYSVQNGNLTNNIAESNSGTGIQLSTSSSYNNISFNNISLGANGIYLYSGCNNNIIKNNTVGNQSSIGIYIQTSCYSNIVLNNTASNNGYGIYLYNSAGNTIYHNSIISNQNQALDNKNNNWWNYSYPTGGNYWSDYNGMDYYSGPNQDQPGSDGIGDTSYIIDSDSIDKYPLIPSSEPEIVLTMPSDNTIYVGTRPGTYVIQFNKLMNVSVGTISTNLPNVTWTWSANGGWYNGTYSQLLNFTTYYVDLTGGDFVDSYGNLLTGDMYKNFTTSDGIHVLPFRIDSNANFASCGMCSEGDGSAGNPWIIKNYDINGTGYGYCIYVGNTTDYFTIENCTLHHASGNSATYFWNSGMILSYLQYGNGILYNNTIYSNSNGVHIYHSNNNAIINNTIFDNSYGIGMDQSDNDIYNNNFINNSWGLRMDLSNTNIYNNNFIDNSYGIDMQNSGANIFNNVFSGNTIAAIYGQTPTNIYNNEFTNNQNAVSIHTVGNAQITENSFVNNSVSVHLGPMVENCHIYSNNFANSPIGESPPNNYWDDGYPAGGNYWSNYIGDDFDYGPSQDQPGSDGIGDVPKKLIEFIIDGEFLGTGNGIQETFPLQNKHIGSIQPIRCDPSGLFFEGIDFILDYENGIVNFSGLHGPPEPGIDLWVDYTFWIQDNYPLMSPYDYTEYGVQLQQGWNLISLPVRQLNWSIDSILESIAGKYDYIQTYNPSNPANPWESYATFKPTSLNNFNSMNHFRGYWIHVTEPGVNLTVKGDTFGSALSIPLKAGWNLVGYPSLVQKSVSEALAGTGYDSVEGFSASDPYRTTVLPGSYMMKPGEGYWVHVPVDTVWVVDW